MLRKVIQYTRTAAEFFFCQCVALYRGTHVDVIPFTPIKQYVLPFASFYSTHRLLAELRADLLYRFSPNLTIILEVRIEIYLRP